MIRCGDPKREQPKEEEKAVHGHSQQVWDWVDEQYYSGKLKQHWEIHMQQCVHACTQINTLSLINTM